MNEQPDQKLNRNPFDFSHPVTKRELFSGRKKELEDIVYYLDEGCLASQPFSLALIGPRASGKTSLLNIIGLEAAKRGYCTVHIKLNERDAETDLAFFFKLFDAILQSVCEFERPADGDRIFKCFGGLAGQVYNEYLDSVYTHCIPEDVTNCPFLFPLQYAKAMMHGNKNASVSDSAFERDLRTISREVEGPIILLMDECNVLADKRHLLEMLRNIFMTIEGYMLVLTGTPSLFPTMDEVFSPIVRQFKKIQVKPFESSADTGDCIARRLQAISLSPEDYFDPETYGDIHDLSCGGPYEIQLICHVMFRRVQQGAGTTMCLDVSVLEEVRQELESSQDVSIRPVIAKVKRLSPDELKALAFFTNLGDCACLEEFWEYYFFVNGEGELEHTQLEDYFNEMMKDGLFVQADTNIEFAGDEFDKIYCKYYGRERGIELRFSALPRFVGVALALDKYLAREIRGHSIGPISAAKLQLSQSDFDRVRDNLRSGKDTFAEEERLWDDTLYEPMMCYEGVSKETMAICNLWLPHFESHFVFVSEGEAISKSLGAEWNLLMARASQLGGSLGLEYLTLPDVSQRECADAMLRSKNLRFKRRAALYHFERMSEAYVEAQDKDVANFHAGILEELSEYLPEAEPLNNLAYWQMTRGEWKKAEDLLSRASETDIEEGIAALVVFNRAVCLVMLGQPNEARVLIGQSRDSARELPEWDRMVGCLFMPVLVAGEWTVEEIFKPDLGEAYDQLAERLCSGSQPGQ